jgi:hypothetical protein
MLNMDNVTIAMATVGLATAVMVVLHLCTLPETPSSKPEQVADDDPSEPEMSEAPAPSVTSDAGTFSRLVVPISASKPKTKTLHYFL